MGRLGRVLLILAVVAAGTPLVPPAAAQTTSATLLGSVRTPQGAPVPGALVLAHSASTGVQRNTTTDASGHYRIDLLTPGTWSVVVRLANGQNSESRLIQLRLQETLVLDFQIGSELTERVRVEAEASRVDPTRTGTELRVEGDLAEGLPINGRVVTDLALLDASIRPTPPGNFYGERGSVFVVNGQSGRANSFLVDGLDNNDRTSGTTLNSFFSQQVIKEFVVLTGQFAPEFGRASGGIMNIVTERGSNEKAGGGFLQGVAAGLNGSGDFVSGLPNPEGVSDTSSRLQTGFHFSGPLREDQSSYFFAFEHQQGNEVVPYTGVDRNGIPGGISTAPSRDDNFFLRTDFNLPNSQFLMVRLSADDRLTSDVNVGGITTPESGFEIRERDYQLATALTWIYSPTLMNEERILVGTSSFEQSANSGRPGVERPSGMFGGNNLNYQLRDEDRVQFVDNLTWQAGAHTVKFGFDLTRTLTDINTRFNPNGNFLYQTDDPFEPGDCGNLLARDAVPGDPRAPVYCPGDPNGIDDDGDGIVDEPGFFYTYPIVFELIEGAPSASLDDKQITLFAQDTWQAGRKLVLNYGLRYDLSTFHLPEDARVPSTIPNGGAPVDRNNVAPRLGFTYSPAETGRVLIRGGAGMFYDKMVLGFPAVAAITSGTRIGLLFPQGLGFELTEDVVEQIGIENLLPELFFPDFLTLRFSTGTTLDTPYTVLYNLGGEFAVGEHGSFQVNATRSLGYHQTLMKDLNPVTVIDIQGLPFHRDPSTGSIAAFVSEGRSWYSGFDVGYRWRNGGTWYSASYTLSKALDLGPDPLKGGISFPSFCAFTDPGDPDLCQELSPSESLAQEKARSDADRRHRVVLSGATALPWWDLHASSVIQVASGAPFNVTTGRDENLDGITTDRPRGVGRNTGADTPLGPVNELRAQEGLSPIHSLEEPALFQIDLRVWKPFAFGPGKGGGEAFVQVFNLMDRNNDGSIEGRVTSRNFGEPLGLAGPSRTLELGLKLAF